MKEAACSEHHSPGDEPGARGALCPRPCPCRGVPLASVRPPPRVPKSLTLVPHTARPTRGRPRAAPPLPPVASGDFVDCVCVCDATLTQKSSLCSESPRGSGWQELRSLDKELRWVLGPAWREGAGKQAPPPVTERSAGAASEHPGPAPRATVRPGFAYGSVSVYGGVAVHASAHLCRVTPVTALRRA